MRDRKQHGPQARAKAAPRSEREGFPKSGDSGEFSIDATQLEELCGDRVGTARTNVARRDAQVDDLRAQQRYKHLYEFAPIPYLHLSADSTVCYANAAASALFATERARLIGAHFSRFVAPESVAQFTLHRRAVADSPERTTCDIALHCEGRRREVRLYSLRGPDGPDDWLMAIVDLGEQHHFERGVKEQAFVSAILDAAGLLVVVDALGCIVRINRNCENLLRESESALHKDFWNVFASATERDLVREAICAPKRGMGRSTTWESSFRAQDGETCCVSWTSTPLSETLDLGQHVILSGIDVTERKSLQEQVVVNDRLAAVGTLAAGVAHEINNPLTYLKSSLELADRAIERERAHLAHGAQLNELLQTAREGADRIRDIVDGLRTFCRSDATSLEALDVREVIAVGLKLARHDIRHRARLVTRYRAVPPVLANSGRLTQVFVNLLVNAAQAIAAGARQTNQICIRTYAKQAQVVIEIRDTGVGIAPESLSRLFDPFFTTKPVGQGTGLGLSVCHNIVSAFGGTITVQSTPGAGSTFRVSLPAALGHSIKPVADLPAVPTARPEVQPLRILIVDDEPRITASMAAMLEPHNVVVVGNGQAALLACLSQTFDLVFCDVLMPEMSGVELYHSLRAAGAGLSDRIVFMTGGAYTREAGEFLSTIPNTVLTKPFSFEALTHIVAERTAH